MQVDLRHLMPISSISTPSISKAAEQASVLLWQNLLASFLPLLVSSLLGHAKTLSDSLNHFLVLWIFCFYKETLCVRSPYRLCW